MRASVFHQAGFSGQATKVKMGEECMKKRTRKPLAFLLTMLLLLTAGAQVLAETPTEEKQVVSEVLEQTAQKEEGKAEQKAEESQQESDRKSVV